MPSSSSRSSSCSCCSSGSSRSSSTDMLHKSVERPNRGTLGHRCSSSSGNSMFTMQQRQQHATMHLHSSRKH
jgi:hypothetical protein